MNQKSPQETVQDRYLGEIFRFYKKLIRRCFLSLHFPDYRYQGKNKNYNNNNDSDRPGEEVRYQTALRRCDYQGPSEV